MSEGEEGITISTAVFIAVVGHHLMAYISVPMKADMTGL